MTSVRPLTEQERVAFGDPTGPTGGRPGFGKDPHGLARCPRLPGQQNRRNLTVRRWLERFNAGSGTAGGPWPAPAFGRPTAASPWATRGRPRVAFGDPPGRRGQTGVWMVDAAAGGSLRLPDPRACRKPGREHRPPAVGASGADAGFVWRRPKLIVRPSAPDSESLARQWAIEAGPETDECDVQLPPVVQAMWMRRGQQVRVPTPGTVFGGLDIRSGATERKLATNFVG